MKVEVAVLSSPSLIVRMVSVETLEGVLFNVLGAVSRFGLAVRR